jgi:hypothetical protein
MPWIRRLEGEIIMQSKLNQFKDKVSALADENEKKTGEKKLARLSTLIDGLPDVKAGSPIHADMEKEIARLLLWVPGKKGGSSISKLAQIDKAFPNNGTKSGLYQPEIICPGNPVDQEKVKKALESIGLVVMGKDWHTPSHQKADIITAENGMLVLDRSKIPTDWA